MADKVYKNNVTIHFPEISDLKEKNTVILETEKYIAAHLEDEKLKELFRFLIEQYGYWIEELIINATASGMKFTADLTSDLQEMLRSEIE